MKPPGGTIPQWLGATLGLAAAYALTGNLGLRLAGSAGHVSAVWPPSGLALGALLIFGNRVWPGIFLGSALVNSSIAWGGPELFPNPLYLTLSYATGAVLQALLGATLIRRAGLYPAPLDEPRGVGGFLLLGGPVACLLAPSLGVAAFGLTHSVPTTRVALSWWTWWVGDTIGVLTFAPLMLVWGGSPREVWRKRRLSMTIPLLLTFTVAVVLFLLAGRGGPSHWQAWTILALGLLFAALLGAFLLTATGRTAQVDLLEEVVAQRTEDLKRALQEAEARTQELEDLDHTVKAINQEMHLKGLLDALLRDLVSHFSQADLGVFMVRHDLTGHFHVVGAHGLSRPVPAEFHLTEEEALARYTQSSEALGAGVYRVRPQAGTPGQTKIAAFGDVKSLLAMSVEIQGQLAGFLVLDNLRDPEAFRDADLAKLHRFREHVISAVNKLRTLHDLERAKELALEAARAKSHFLANMSHEIRTPMNAILGFASLGLKQDFPPKAREYFQKISNSGESLLGVINDILDFSKIEAGKLELESVSFDLPELLATTSDLFAHTAMDKGLELIVSAGIRVPRLIVGDPLRLAQVLTNLTGNALKFTEHGQVHVRVDLLDQTEGQAHLHFAVSDTGIGISPEQQALVFSAFSQADTSNTRRFGGTGLGLSISKRLVEMMGGELFVQSEFGVGSTFSFSLHLPFDPDQPPAVRQAPGDLIGLRVLVVDDNDIARTVLVEQLRAFGFEVRAVASAAAAMDVLASTTPADTFGMVLLDWRMPEMDGLEALRHIQAVTRDPKPKIILSTAFGHDELRKRAMALDVAGFLPKPLSSSRLLDGILEALGRETPTSQPLPKKPLLSGNRPYLLGARILLVEDNPINQQVASEILAGEGLRVQVAASGPEAIHAVDHGSFDAVLMDIQMPGMDGYETTALLRERSQNMDLPIIAMTAHALEGYREQCLAAGMNDYLTKPVDPEALFQVLGKWIPGRERKPPAAPLPVAAPPWPELPTSVPGFDVSGGIRRLGGKAPLFLRLVADLRRDYAQAGLQIRAALEAGDQGHAESLAHTVKGVAGNLNATELQAAAGALEQTLRAPGRGALPQALEAFDKALALTLEGCRTLDPGGSKDALFTGGPVGEAAANLLEELHRHILNHDPRAEETLEILRSHLRAPGLQPRLNLLGECLGSYEFQGALVVLADVRRGLGEPL